MTVLKDCPYDVLAVSHDWSRIHLATEALSTSCIKKICSVSFSPNDMDFEKETQESLKVFFPKY